MTRKNQGICYLVGSGPGDLGLVTLRAKECIEIADVVLYDYLCNPEILQWARPDAEIIYVGKKAADHTIPRSSSMPCWSRRPPRGRSSPA